MRKEKLEIVFPLHALSAQDAWQIIRRLQGLPHDAIVMLYELRLNASALTAALAKMTHFDIKGNGCAFHFSRVTDFDHCLLQIQLESTSSVPLWDKWVKACSKRPLVSARLFDAEYEYWQNAEDPIEYTSQRRTFSHLTLRSNDLPYPLTQQIIDISQNPGRRQLRDGYVEAVGATMWVTPLFHKLTGSNLDALKSLPLCRCNPVCKEVIRLQVMEQCFKSAEGREGDIQNRLRAALFPFARLNEGRQSRVEE